MNREQIMEAMNHIDPALIEAADRNTSTAKRSRRGWSKPAIIAACLCLVLAGTALAVELSGVHITGFFENEPRITDPSGTEELVSGYTIGRGIRYFSVEDFSQEIIDLNQGFAEPAAKKFSTWEKMEEFVGLKVMDNPVLAEAHKGGLVDVGLPDGEGTFVVRLDPGCGHVSDGVTPMTGITNIEMYGSYYLRYNDPDLQPWSGISVTVCAEVVLDTENNVLDEMEIYYDNAAVAQESYVTPNGLPVLIFKAEIPEQEGGSVPSPAVDWYTAYFTLDGVFFRISTVDYKDFNGGSIPAGLIEQTLKEVLDGFVCAPAN